MIAVAGINTAIDRLIEVEAFAPGLVVRARRAVEWPGGKGTHVAMCVAMLGEKVRLVGLIDAARRPAFAEWLRARAVEFHGIDTEAPIRTCLTIRDDAGYITEIREPGAAIDGDVWRAVVSRITLLSSGARVVVLSGSVPAGAPATGYADLIAASGGASVLVDASGDLLRHAVRAAPFCVKANSDEAQALTGLTIGGLQEAARAVRVIASSGVQLAIISLGAAGAVACWRNRVCSIAAPPVTSVNTVGAGDCLLGGIATGLARGCEMEDVLRLGVACGTAKVLSPEIGSVCREDVDRLLPAIRVVWHA